VAVTLEGAGNAIRLSVKDSGIGFTPAAGEGGIGLLSMKARVELVGGDFDIRSRPGEGTEVLVALPLESR
jgi:signal transduction histidine kinase